MGLLDDTRVKVLLVAFVLSLLGLVATASFGLLAVVSVLAGPSSTGPLLFVLLEAAAPYVIATALVGIVSFLLLVALVVAGVRRASMPRNDRLAALARKVERVSPEARKTGLAERFEPTTEDRIADLKQRYVEDEITELEYERRLQNLLDETNASDEQLRGDITRTRRESEFER